MANNRIRAISMGGVLAVLWQASGTEAGPPGPGPGAPASKPVAAAVLTLRFSDMGQHRGQTLKLRVVDETSDAEVARVVVDSIASSAFDVRVEGLETGGSYRVDFYADLNENGEYDAPPDDHAWRVRLKNLQGDVVQDFAHGPFFTDIAWPPAPTAVETQSWGMLKGRIGQSVP